MLDFARTSAAPDGASNALPSTGRSHADRPVDGHGADRSFADTLAWLSGAIHGRAGARAHDGAVADAEQTDDSSSPMSPASGTSSQTAVQSGLVPDWTAGLHAGRHGQGAGKKDEPASSADAADETNDTSASADAAALIAGAAVPATPAMPPPDVDPSAASEPRSSLDADATTDTAARAGDVSPASAAAHGGRASRHNGHRHAGAARAEHVADLVTTNKDAAADGRIVADRAAAANVTDAADAGIGTTDAGTTTDRASNTRKPGASAPLSPKAAGAAADAAAPARRRTADVGASPVTRRIAEAAAQRASADQDSPAFAPSSPESRAAASAGARDSAQSTQTTNGDDRANIQDRASAPRQDIADRAPRPRDISVIAATDAAVRASAQSAGTSAHDSQTGAGPSAPVASSRPAASAQPAPSLTFGLGSGLLTGAGPTLAPLHASNVDSTTWSSGETLPESTVNQIVQAIRLQWTNGAGEARITLEPDQFGDVTISVRVERGQVSARVEADTPVVREWLQSNQQTLRHGLAEQNLKLDRLEVAAPPQSRDADRREGGRQRGDQPPPRRQRQPQGQETFEVVA